jgi:hypothetical protein
MRFSSANVARTMAESNPIQLVKQWPNRFLSVRYIEILHRSYARRSTFEERGSIFWADLHPIFWSEERFCRSPKNCSIEVNYVPCLGWISADFLQGVLSPKKFAGHVPTYLFFIVLRFLWLAVNQFFRQPRL